MSDINIAKNLLKTNNFTLILTKGDALRLITMRGIKPLVILYETKDDFSGFAAADKVVGKGAAYMYVLLKVGTVYAEVLSRAALEVFKRYGISIQYDELVDNISNRQGDGVCPFEEAVLSIHSPEDAYKAIRAKMVELNIEMD